METRNIRLMRATMAVGARDMKSWEWIGKLGRAFEIKVCRWAEKANIDTSSIMARSSKTRFVMWAKCQSYRRSIKSGLETGNWEYGGWCLFFIFVRRGTIFSVWSSWTHNLMKPYSLWKTNWWEIGDSTGDTLRVYPYRPLSGKTKLRSLVL